MTVSEEALETLRQKWQNECEYIKQARDRLNQLQGEIEDLDADDDHWRHKVLVINCLSDSYCGIERVLKEIVKQIDEEDPEARDRWHKWLVETVATESEAREPVLSKEGKQSARSLIEFRHMDRFNYPQEIDWDGLMAGVESYRELFPPLFDEVTEFMDNVRDRITVEIIPAEVLEGRDGLDLA